MLFVTWDVFFFMFSNLVCLLNCFFGRHNERRKGCLRIKNRKNPLNLAAEPIVAAPSALQEGQSKRTFSSTRQQSAPSAVSCLLGRDSGRDMANCTFWASPAESRSSWLPPASDFARQHGRAFQKEWDTCVPCAPSPGPERTRPSLRTDWRRCRQPITRHGSLVCRCERGCGDRLLEEPLGDSANAALPEKQAST